jgi:CRISPR-associated protein Cmr6
MSIKVPFDTFNALGGRLLDRCESRSLFQGRFADPQATDNTTPTRKDWFNALIKRKAQGTSTAVWLPTNAEQLHARLMSRLMVDFAGGVMENANILLDRYGLPNIPGSAVKGCARRMALQALHDWVAAGTERPAEDDACAPCCEGFEKPAQMLAVIARVFGWVEKDWDAGKMDGLFRSDFGWACGENHEAIWAEACKHLAQTFGWKLSSEKPWKKLPNFAGAIAFLSAHPNTDPGLELDVVTPHHTKYYQSKDPNAVATDTEDPIPVYFPAVKPQRDTDYFTFPLIPLRRTADGDLATTKTWLAHGLQLFGLGAKTAAGYGWFQPISEAPVAASDYLNEAIFKNLVLSKLNSPSQLNQLESQIPILQKSENATWLEKLKASLLGKENKDLRKRLKDKDWFPKDWLPQ